MTLQSTQDLTAAVARLASNVQAETDTISRESTATQTAIQKIQDLVTQLGNMADDSDQPMVEALVAQINQAADAISTSTTTISASADSLSAAVAATNTTTPVPAPTEPSNPPSDTTTSLS